MKCNACGKEIKNKMAFCPYCNAKQPISASSETPLLMKSVAKQDSEISFVQEKTDVLTETLKEEVSRQDFLEKIILNDTDEWILADSNAALEETKNATKDNIKEPVCMDTIRTPENKAASFKRKHKKSDSHQKEAYKKINKDGYYDPTPPLKKEEFPFLKGEFIAKVIFLILTIIILALFLIYFI